MDSSRWCPVVNVSVYIKDARQKLDYRTVRNIEVLKIISQSLRNGSTIINVTGHIGSDMIIIIEGELAQMVERPLSMREVARSMLAFSTSVFHRTRMAGASEARM